MSKQDKEQTKQDKEQTKQDKEHIRQAYTSKHNDKHDNQVNLLMMELVIGIILQ